MSLCILSPPPPPPPPLLSLCCTRSCAHLLATPVLDAVAQLALSSAGLEAMAKTLHLMVSATCMVLFSVITSGCVAVTSVALCCSALYAPSSNSFAPQTNALHNFLKFLLPGSRSPLPRHAVCVGAPWATVTGCRCSLSENRP